ncbi:hypothetical protein Esti_005028 [Eimeria stiedai]
MSQSFDELPPLLSGASAAADSVGPLAAAAAAPAAEDAEQAAATAAAASGGDLGAPDENACSEAREEAAECLLNEEAIKGAISKLRMHRAACAKQSRYAEAQKAHKHIAELQAYLLAAKQQQTRSKHLLRQAAVERCHFREITRLTSAWLLGGSCFVSLFAERLHAELRRRQLDEAARRLEADLLTLQPRMLHASNNLLKLRQQQALQAKAHKYEAAARIKKVADRLERDEFASWRRQRVASLARRFDLLQQQQRNERESLEARLAAARQQLGNLHADALQQLKKRYLYLTTHTSRSIGVVVRLLLLLLLLLVLLLPRPLLPMLLLLLQQRLEYIRLTAQLQKAAEKELQ